ncbi:MAG: Sec-independent protein translocase protein TatB [Actinomycetota bacterium]
MFNLSGSEIVIILLLALIVLGPEKLPEAIRRFGRIYGELRKMGSGFQSEFRNAFDEPLNELRETARLTREAVLNPTEDASPSRQASPSDSTGDEPDRP